MPEIILTTYINAPIDRCFNLARSINLHQKTSAKTQEKAIAGTITGLIEKGETVTWRARHFGMMQTLTSMITRMDAPYMFEDCMVKGVFRKIQHQHWFESVGSQTVMKDIFIFESPLGFLGRLFNALILTKYLTRFLEERNQAIKEVAESNEWKVYII